MRNNHKVFDINFYQEFLDEIYLVVNRDRDFDNLYGYLDRTSGYLGKAIKAKVVKPKDFILPLSWLFSLATKLEINLETAFLKKYPKICPYCLQKNCICYKTGKMPPNLSLSASEIRHELRMAYESVLNNQLPFHLDNAVRMIKDIFAVNEAIWIFAGEHWHIDKIHEEIAEIHEAYGSYSAGNTPLNAVSEEIADVFAWIIAAWGILYPDISMEAIFNKYYSSGCPICNSIPCNCEYYASRLQSLIDINQLALAKNKLEELNGFVSYEEDVFNKLLEAYDDILDTHNAPITKNTISQTKILLDDLKLISFNDNSGEIIELITGIEVIINNILRLEDVKMSKPNSYEVFFSYSFSDADRARELFDFLEKNGISVFMSEKMSPGVKWKSNIQDALSNSKKLLILASKNSVKSEWVISEWGAAWALDIPIIPVLYQCSLDDLPDRLRDYQCVDFHEFEKILESL